jgi:hypothetical protein
MTRHRAHSAHRGHADGCATAIPRLVAQLIHHVTLAAVHMTLALMRGGKRRH